MLRSSGSCGDAQKVPIKTIDDTMSTQDNRRTKRSRRPIFSSRVQKVFLHALESEIDPRFDVDICGRAIYLRGLLRSFPGWPSAEHGQRQAGVFGGCKERKRIYGSASPEHARRRAHESTEGRGGTEIFRTRAGSRSKFCSRKNEFRYL